MWKGRIDPTKPEVKIGRDNDDNDDDDDEGYAENGGDRPCCTSQLNLWVCLRKPLFFSHVRDHFFEVPQIKFRLRFASYSVFLVLYGACLSQADKLERVGFSTIEVLLYGMSCALLADEIDQIRRDWARNVVHFSRVNSTNDLWNWLDLIVLLALITGFGLKVLALTGLEQSCLVTYDDGAQARRVPQALPARALKDG